MKTKSNDTGKPQIYFGRLSFNDGTEIELDKGSIVVFTGANNCGKSQVLKDIETCSDRFDRSHIVIVKNGTRIYCGDILNKDFINTHFADAGRGELRLNEAGTFFSMSNLKDDWESHVLRNGLRNVFVHRLNTEQRLISSNEVSRNHSELDNPTYKMCKHMELEAKISEFFNQAFGYDLVVNRNEITTIPLHVGKAPDKRSYTMDKMDDYYSLVAKMPKLQEQGDGMRSFAGILLDTFTSDCSITLIDEPEAFLHPSQARVLGRMLADNNPDNRQLFISTHSENFLQGLLDTKRDKITVIRINRIDNINRMCVLPNEGIKKLWSNPLLRYSNILSGLFHKKVVVCESDYDCLFYQAMMDAIVEMDDEVSPDVLFIHCGGKGRIKEAVNALKAVGVPVVAVCDFDILDDRNRFETLLSAFNADITNDMAESMDAIYDIMGNSRDGLWKDVKNRGKDGLPESIKNKYSQVEDGCKAEGLFVVPVGEMEDFDKTNGKRKRDWVYYVIEHYDLRIESRLESAREFVQEIIDY